MKRDWQTEDDIAEGVKHDGTLRGKIEFYVKSAGEYFLVVCLIYQVLNTLGLGPRQLRHLGPDGWKVLTPMIVLACIAYAWAHRGRPKLVAVVLSASLIATFGMAVLGYRVHQVSPLASRSSSSSSSSGSSRDRVPEEKNIPSAWFRPFELFVGELPANVQVLVFEIEGDFTNDEYKAIGEWLHERLPDARLASLQGLRIPGKHPPVERTPQYHLGPIKNTSQFLAKIDFAELIPSGRNSVRMIPKRPLQISGNSPANRTAYYLTELRSNDSGRQLAAANLLKELEPFEQRDEIGSTLFRLLTEPNRFRDFYPAWNRWASAGQVDSVLSVLLGIESALNTDPTGPKSGMLHEQRFQLFQTLSRIAPDHATAWFCDFATKELPYNRDPTLLQLGGALAEVAEAHVTQLLQNNEPEIQRAACRALSVRGTQDSIPALETLAMSPDRVLSTAAKNAISEIRSRSPRRQ